MIPTSHKLIDIGYQYFNNANIYRIDDKLIPDLSLQYTYDDHDRIRSVALDGGSTREYRFDNDGQQNSKGNLTLRDKRKLYYDSGKTYPTRDEVHKEDTQTWEANQTFTWSGTGSLLSKGGVFDYEYDAGNMMSRAVEKTQAYSQTIAAETKFFYDNSGERFLKEHYRAGYKIRTWYLGDGIEIRQKFYSGTLTASQKTKYIYGMNDKRLAAITDPVLSAMAATSDAMFALADSYSLSTVSGMAAKSFYTFYGIYAHDNFGKTARVTSLSLAAILLLLYLVFGQQGQNAFPVWMRLAAITTLISFLTVNCGTGNNPNSLPTDYGGTPGNPGLGQVGTATTASTLSAPALAALFDGLPNGTLYYTQNHLSSSSLITNENGEEVLRIVYDEYGNIDFNVSGKYDLQSGELSSAVAQVEFVTLAYRFTDHIYDVETGFFYAHARYFDPQLGIFTTADTEFDERQGSFAHNRHMYVRGNPIMYTDPTGHFFFMALLTSLAVWGGGGAAIRGAATGDWSAKNLATGFAQGMVAWGAAGLGFAAGAAAAGGGTGFSATVTSGTVGGYVGGFSGGIGNAILEGRSFEEVLGAGMLGGMIGAAAGFATSATFYGAGKAWDAYKAFRKGPISPQTQRIMDAMGKAADDIGHPAPETFAWGGENPVCDSRGCIPVHNNTVRFEDIGGPGNSWGASEGSLNSHTYPALDFGGTGPWRGPVNQSFRVISAGVENNRFGSAVRIQLGNGDRLTFVHMTRINRFLRLAAGTNRLFRGDTVLGETAGLIGRATGRHLHIEGVNAAGENLGVDQIRRYLRGY